MRFKLRHSTFHTVRCLILGIGAVIMMLYLFPFGAVRGEQDRIATLFVQMILWLNMGIFLRDALAQIYPLGYIKVTENRFSLWIFPIRRSIIWSETQRVEMEIGQGPLPYLVATGHDGRKRRRIRAAFSSPPDNDWWAEVIKQMDAHGIEHPGLDLENGRPFTSLDIDLKTGQISLVSGGKVRKQRPEE